MRGYEGSITRMTPPLKGLRIPMRGYESHPVNTSCYVITRYESPCGVMRLPAPKHPLPTVVLRIPMRGYEILDCHQLWYELQVTNPHAGL